MQEEQKLKSPSSAYDIRLSGKIQSLAQLQDVSFFVASADEILLEISLKLFNVFLFEFY
jgi:hypothetical protein